MSKAVGRILVAAALMLSGAAVALAQAPYPTKPIHIIVPLPPGANGDLMPRILGQQLSTRLGQPVVIDFRAEPDGYTLLATPQGPLVISPSFIPNLSFDPAQFVPVTIMARLPYILVVHPKVPVASFAEFIAYAKANPDRLNYGSPGIGSSTHLTGEMLSLPPASG
jgi:tripartite-type tricarboxylate transporter receptor subunit TctC